MVFSLLFIREDLENLMKVKNYVTTLVLGLISISCSDVRLGEPVLPPVQQKSVGDFCISPPESLERFTKFLFVMDKSGSNGSMDPGANLRAGSIETFYQDNRNNPYFKWGMVTFQGSDSKAEIEGPYFTQDENMVNDAITSLRSGDGDSTPYGSALSVSRLAIETDIDENPDEDSVYMVFFVSDGVPTDVRDVSKLRGMVRDLVNAKPGRIFLSTAYYGSNGGSAISKLKEMAEEGHGKFVDLNSGSDLDYNELIVEPTTEPWQLKRKLLTYNLNASICEDGKIGIDSDSDGLCDIDEVKYGLDPQKRFSFKTIKVGDTKIDVSGFGDYFHWRRLVFNESLPECRDRSDEDFDMLTKCEEEYILNMRPSGTLNGRTTGDPKNPDTDLDGFLDGIELMVFKDKGSPMNDQNVLDSYDGEDDNAGTQIEQHRNPFLYDPDAVAYDTNILPIGIEEGSYCYSFQQNILELFNTLEVKAEDTLPGLAHEAGENVVYVYYIQTPQSDPSGPGMLKYDIQKIKYDPNANKNLGPGNGLQIRSDVFKSYLVPMN